MSWLADLLGVYGRVLRRTFDLTVQNWWLGLVAIAYQGMLLALMLVLGPLGMVGGFLMGFAMAALMSSWLVLVGHVVRAGRTTLADLPGSYVVHLGDVLTFGFLLWALQYIASIAFADFAYATIVFELALLVFLSAVPEEIYLGNNAGVAVFVESYRFVAAHWIEWLPATALLLVLTVIASAFPFLPVALVTGGIALAFMFIGRGLLFLELTTSSRRAREYQRRLAG
jgi:hypothetical protein